MSRIADMLHQLALDFGANAESWRGAAEVVDRREREERGRQRCPSCALPINDSSGICLHHHFNIVDPDGYVWSTGNRAACDFFHRGIVQPSPALDPTERITYFGRVDASMPDDYRSDVEIAADIRRIESDEVPF